MISKLSLVVFVTFLANAEIPNNFGNLPLRFETAQDKSGHARFLARGKGYTLSLTDTGAVLQFPSIAVRMKMLGANPSATITPQQPLPGATNYLIGNDPSKWRTGVTGFARVEYRGIYPGIDLVYYGNEGHLEYDFVLTPRSDPRKIQIAFDGSARLAIDKNGDLIVSASGQALSFRKPELYQIIDGEKRPIAGHYDLHGRQVGFKVSAYNPSLPLVIDPVLLYSTLFGGYEDTIFAMTTDAAGNVYLTGQTEGTIPTMNPEQPKFNGNGSANVTNAFITKINAAGTALIYSTFIGGSGGDHAFGVAVDPSGNAYIAGYTFSSDFPTVNAIQPKLQAPFNAFVTKLNTAGSALVYSTYLGGGGDRANAIAVDPAGNAYIAGTTYSTDFPTVAPFQATKPGQEAAFVTKINAAGSTLTYSTYLGGNATNSSASAQNIATGIAVDAAGSAYVTGSACSSNFPTVNPVQATNKSAACNAFVSKFTPAGSALVYSTYLGGSAGNPLLTDLCDQVACAGAGDTSVGIAIDSGGNATVSGTAISSDFPVVNALQPAPGGGSSSGYIAKLNASGSALLYSTYFGGSANVTGIAGDAAGNAYITGGACGNGFSLPLVKPLQLVGCAYVAELNSAGSALVYSTYFAGGAGGAATSAIAVDSGGNAYVAGITEVGFPGVPLVNAIQPTPMGTYPSNLAAAFLAKIGSADAAGLATAPATLNFSNVFIGTSAAPQTISVFAAGSQPLRITTIAATGDFTQTNNCTATLAAASTCTVNVTFTPTAEGSRTGSLTIASSAGNFQPVSLTGFGLMPALTAATQNSAGYLFTNAAGSLASIFGTDLALSIGYGTGFPLPTTIAGVTVTVTGQSGSYPAPLLYVSPTQINFQIPWEVAGNSQVTIKVDSVSIPLPLSPTAPGIFALNSQGTGPGAILIANAFENNGAVFAQPPGSTPGRESHPVSAGQYISIYCTGLGAVTGTPPADGSYTTSVMPIADPATVSIGGITVTPSFAGLAPGFVGLYQVNAQVPTGVSSGNAVPVFITIGGVVSNMVTIAVP